MIKTLNLIDYYSILDKTNLKRSHKYVALSNLSMYYRKKSYKNNEFKISGPAWNENFELPDRSYSVLNILDYFQYIISKHQTVTDNPLIRIYVKKGLFLYLKKGTISNF